MGESMTRLIVIDHEVTTSFRVTVERQEIPKDHAELLESITINELTNGSRDLQPNEWGHIKYAWRRATPGNTWVYDENNDPIFACPEHF